MRWKSLVCGAVLSVALAVPAQAAPIGHLNIDSGGNGVRVTYTTIDWVPLGGGDGLMITGFGTDVDYTGGNLGAGVIGTIKDLPPVPVADFMTFTGHPLSFDLTGIGPGSPDVCTEGVTQIGDSCSVFAGSPFVLTWLNANTTFVGLGAFGTATDGDGVSNWIGLFSTQFTLTPFQIINLLNTQGYVDSTYSGSFDVTLIPEPTTLALFGLGLLGTAYRARRRLL